jgi:hypothetical protein
VLFIGDPQLTRIAEKIELNGCNAEEIAELYGYPICCAQSYDSIQKGELWLVPFLSEVKGPAQFDWRLNRFARLFSPGLSILPDYFPCRADCKASLNLAERYWNMLIELGLNDLAEVIQSHLSQVILIHQGAVSLLRRIDGIKAERYRMVATQNLQYKPEDSCKGILEVCKKGDHLVWEPDLGPAIDLNSSEAQLLYFN